MKTCILTGVPGKPLRIKAGFVSTASGAIKALSKYKAAIMAGDKGSITVWKTPSGYHCDLSRFRRTCDEADVRTLKEVKRWLIVSLQIIK